MEGSLPDNYNMLHKMYAEVNDSLGDVELDAKSDEKTSGTTTMVMKKEKKSKKKKAQQRGRNGR